MPRFPFPLGPLLERRTVRYEVERGRLWMFEQEQSLANSTATNVRMVAIRLASGGLWIHAPIAPTRCRVPPEPLHVNLQKHPAVHLSGHTCCAAKQQLFPLKLPQFA